MVVDYAGKNRLVAGLVVAEQEAQGISGGSDVVAEQEGIG